MAITAGGAGRNNAEGSEETEMFNMDFQRIATAAVGALILTVASVGAAVGPARSVETSPVALAQSQVADRANV